MCRKEPDGTHACPYGLALTYLGSLLRRQVRYTEAQGYFREAIRMLRWGWGDANPAGYRYLASLQEVQEAQGKQDAEEEQLWRWTRLRDKTTSWRH